MKSGINNTKFILVMAISCLMLASCNRSSEADNSEKKFNVSYTEWADSIGLFDNPDFDVTSYSEDKGANNSIEIHIDHPKDVKRGFEALNDMVKEHNDFVTNNPGYFNDYIDINIYVLYSPKFEVIYYSNIGTIADSAITGIKQDAEIDYVELNVSCTSELIKENVAFDFPYVILNVDRGEKNVLDAEDNYLVLDCCQNYSTVFIETLRKSNAGRSAEIVAGYNDAARVFTSNSRKDFEKISE